MKNLIASPTLAATLGSLLLSIHAGFAQGTAFTYQGRLNDGANSATGSYDLRLILFDATVGGSQQGPILTNATTAVSNGLFTIALDFGNQFPGAGRWLEISVRTNGGGNFFTLSPRQALTPAPYAITAGSVVSGGLSAGNYGNPVTLNNPANSLSGSFTGNGANITNVNAAALGGLASSNFWQSAGNNLAAGNFLGSSNNQPMEIRVNNLKAMQYAYASNVVSGFSPNIVGGHSSNNVAAGVVGATIGGGGAPGFLGANVVSADFGTVVGGFGSAASGRNAVAGGGASVASGQYSVALGFLCRAGGDYATAMGNATAQGPGSTAFGISSATNNYATAMGASSASGFYSTAMGNSAASGEYSTAMGLSVATEQTSTAMGGSSANGRHSTAMGTSIANGDDSFAAGYAIAQKNGGFVWGDYSTFGRFDPYALSGSQGVVNSFNVRSTGGFYIASAINTTSGQITSGVQLTAGSGTWASYSDRNAKTNFSAVDSRKILDQLVSIPIETWNYKAQSQTIKHIGPMAQDFAAAFKVGEDDTHITTVDADGVALAAIQGLNQKVDELKTALNRRDAENQDLKQELSEIKQILARLASHHN